MFGLWSYLNTNIDFIRSIMFLLRVFLNFKGFDSTFWKSYTLLIWNGGFKWNISYNSIPNDHISMAMVWFSPIKISGAIYSNVPQTEFLFY